MHSIPQNTKSSANRYLQSFLVVFRDPVWIRTKDPQLRRLLLYPTELRDQFSERKSTLLLLNKLLLF